MKQSLKLALDEIKRVKEICLREVGIGLCNEVVIAKLEEALAQPEQSTTCGEPDGIVLTNIPHPKGAPAPDDLNADSLEVVELELPDEDEAVGWADGGVINWIAGKQFKHASYLYTTPPQRTAAEGEDTRRAWVGLSEKEAHELWESTDSDDDWELMKRTEAKLKEKNT